MKNIDQFVARLPINKHALDEELVTHSDVMFAISEELGRAQVLAVNAGDMLRRMEADAFAVQKAGGASDKLADMQARSDRHRMEAFVQAEEAKSDVGRWQALLDAWKQKGHAMRELVALYQAQYFALDPAGRERPARAATTTSREREPTRTRRSAA